MTTAFRTKEQQPLSTLEHQPEADTDRDSQQSAPDDIPTILQRFNGIGIRTFEGTAKTTLLVGRLAYFSLQYGLDSKAEYAKANPQLGRYAPDIKACRHRAKGNVLATKAATMAGLAQSTADTARSFAKLTEQAAQQVVELANMAVDHPERTKLTKTANDLLKLAEWADQYATQAQQWADSAKARLK